MYKHIRAYKIKNKIYKRLKQQRITNIVNKYGEDHSLTRYFITRLTPNFTLAAFGHLKWTYQELMGE